MTCQLLDICMLPKARTNTEAISDTTRSSLTLHIEERVSVAQYKLR